ncbi:hypothetical protein XELAEV_180314423mg, partial [Xenopus laevis]
GLSGTCLFFLRTTEKAITTANISQEVNFNMFECTNGSILHGLETLLSQVMVPSLKCQENWGAVADGMQNLQIQEYLDSLDKFIGTLSSARHNLEGKIELKRVDSSNFLENMHPSDFINA